MNAKEIVKAAVEHRETGKVPYCIDFDKDGFNLYAEPLMKRYGSPRINKLLEKGIITQYEAVSLAIGNHVFSLRMPWWEWYQLPEEYLTSHEPPDYLPKTIGTGSYEDSLEKIKAVKEYAECYILIRYYGSHSEKAMLARGSENFYADTAASFDYCKRLLDYIISKNIVMLDNIIHIPEIDGIMIGGDWGTQKASIFNPEVWRKLVLPGEKIEYDLIKSGGKHVWIHSCGNIAALIPMLVDIGLEVLNPVQPECMDIYKLKREYGNNLSFWGGISTQRTLPSGSVDEVIAETRHVITEMSRGGGYITAPSQHIQTDVSFENVCAIIDTAKEFC